MKLPMVLGFSLVLAFSPFAASAQSGLYDTCMAKVNEQPLAAYEMALAWKADGGGAPARHCIASALLGLGDFERAAVRLDNLGHAPEFIEAPLRASIFAQAGETWLQINQPAKAETAFRESLKHQPQDLQFRVDLARALAAQEKEDLAISELDQVLLIHSGHLLALRLRATTKMRQGLLLDAQSDVNRAMTLAPTDIDVLLLRGQLREAIRIAN